MSKSKGVEMGWREYLALPELGVDSIKAKVDTGALTSAIHATDIQVSTVDGSTWVDFNIMPSQSVMPLQCVVERRLSDTGRCEILAVCRTNER